MLIQPLYLIHLNFTKFSSTKLSKPSLYTITNALLNHQAILLLIYINICITINDVFKVI